MRFIADLHIHSRYSRATSSAMSPESLWKWAQLKGINVVATGDFTHPHWYEEIKEKLYTEGSNLFKLKDNYKTNAIPAICSGEVCFLLTTEVSCIYKKNGKVRKVHCLIFAPDLATVSKINIALSKIGNIASDGRPILGLDAKKLLEIVLDISDDAMLVPAFHNREAVIVEIYAQDSSNVPERHSLRVTFDEHHFLSEEHLTAFRVELGVRLEFLLGRVKFREVQALADDRALGGGSLDQSERFVVLDIHEVWRVGGVENLRPLGRELLHQAVEGPLRVGMQE